MNYEKKMFDAAASCEQELLKNEFSWEQYDEIQKDKERYLSTMYGPRKTEPEPEQANETKPGGIKGGKGVKGCLGEVGPLDHIGVDDDGEQ